jgi:hypothetical protein
MQRSLLEEEGVTFNPEGVIDFEKFGWLGCPQNHFPVKRRKI